MEWFAAQITEYYYILIVFKAIEGRLPRFYDQTFEVYGSLDSTVLLLCTVPRLVRRLLDGTSFIIK